MIKTRIFEESNYKGIWFNGKTIRVAIDPAKPITELKYPEFYDVKITGQCKGICPWCYMDSKPTDEHYMDAVQKINDFFGPMSPNERPFQVAIGGGEPTSHPQFVEILKAFYDLGIQPNYTTNGMWTQGKVKDLIDMVRATGQYCGGVAVSCHSHLRAYWEEAAKLYAADGIKLNFHLIISDKKSVDDFAKIYELYNERVDYFVLLPYGEQGRAPKKEIEWEYLVSKLPRDQRKIAFGANFYENLLSPGHGIKVSLYEPEIMSKFLDLKDMKLYPSSFCTDKPLN